MLLWINASRLARCKCSGSGYPWRLRAASVSPMAGVRGAKRCGRRMRAPAHGISTSADAPVAESRRCVAIGAQESSMVGGVGPEKKTTSDVPYGCPPRPARTSISRSLPRTGALRTGIRATLRSSGSAFGGEANVGDLGRTRRDGTSNIGFATKARSGRAECRLNPNLERPCSGDNAAHRSSGRPWTTPIVCILRGSIELPTRGRRCLSFQTKMDVAQKLSPKALGIAGSFNSCSGDRTATPLHHRQVATFGDGFLAIRRQWPEE